MSMYSGRTSKRSIVENVSKRRKQVVLTSIPSRSLMERTEIRTAHFRTVFRDAATLSPFYDPIFKDHQGASSDQIHLDGLLAGWGSCALQVTFQAESLRECVHLYDQLLPLTGIMVTIQYS